MILIVIGTYTKNIAKYENYTFLQWMLIDYIWSVLIPLHTA